VIREAAVGEVEEEGLAASMAVIKHNFLLSQETSGKMEMGQQQKTATTTPMETPAMILQRLETNTQGVSWRVMLGDTRKRKSIHTKVNRETATEMDALDLACSIDNPPSISLSLLHLITEAELESESEVDLSGLLARVAKLDSSRTSKAFSSHEARGLNSDAVDDEDIDQSLLYLLDRQREREGGRSTADDSNGQIRSSRPPGLTPSEMRHLEMEGKRLLEERERERRHFGRAEMLKSKQSKTISLNIGENRNVKESQPSKPGGRTPRNVNRAALYDTEEEDSKEDGVDIFLQALNSSKRDTSSAAKLPIVSPPLPALASLPASTRRKEDEDFLDSII
jgi:hypothetical protein